MYPEAYEVLDVQIPGYVGNCANCLFFGKETDKFHMPILVNIKRYESPFIYALTSVPLSSWYS
jgi:hypothetical protein